MHRRDHRRREAEVDSHRRRVSLPYLRALHVHHYEKDFQLHRTCFDTRRRQPHNSKKWQERVKRSLKRLKTLGEAFFAGLAGLGVTVAAEMAEMANFDELVDDQCSSTRSAMMPSQTAQRDSFISVSKFNRFIVGELARKNGDEGRVVMESLRKERDHAAETHRQYGASLGAASRAQMQRDKQKYDALREANLLKGMQVREDVVSQKGEAQRLRQEWIDYGRKLAEKDAEQKRRIRDVCGEGSKRVQDRVAQAKFEEEEYEAELKNRRAEILRDNQAEVRRVREETADTVIDASKQFSLDRRRGVAAETKESVLGWKSARDKNTQDHLKSARQNRADAERSRAEAKKLRERLVMQKKQEAATARELMKRNKLVKDQQLLESGAGVKAVHDGIYRSKYVPSDSADYLTNHKYGKSTVG